MSERINDDSEFDVISDVLETLRFHGTIFFRSELAAPWGVLFPQIGLPRFHIALSGSFYAAVNNKEAVNIQEMDIVMLPDGESHWIADQPGRDLIPSEQINDACELSRSPSQHNQQGEITNRLMCGIVHYDRKARHPIFDSLPEVLHFPKFESTDPIWMLVMLIDAEMHQSQGRGGTIVDRLTEALFLKLINRHANENEEVGGFLAALGDRRIYQSLMLIHREPNFNWTLASLGKRIGMSRATLTRRFQNTVGIAPMTYITNWRITKAYSLVKYTDTNLEQIAESVGFSSARTLSKAFQRIYDCSPGELRKKKSAA